MRPHFTMISHLQEVLRLYRATCWSIVWKFHLLKKSNLCA